MEKLKHKLPPYSIVEHLCLTDLQLTGLENCIKQLESDFKSVLEINKNLCGIHHDLSSSVYDNFYQISLTDSIAENKDITIGDCEIIHKNLHSLSHSQNIRNKKLTSSSGSALDETTYIKKTDIYGQYQELFDSVLSKFKGYTTRIRLVKLKAGTNVPPHIDYDPGYSVRFIFPIIADDMCLNVFWVKNNIEIISFKPGNAYFLNTGYKHAVLNFSKNDRYTFMVSVKGIEDINHLLSE